MATRRDPRIERYAGPKYGSPAARATGCAEAVGRVAVRSRRGVDRRCVGRGGRIVLVHSGPSTAAGDATSVAGRVRGSGDRQPCAGVLGALRAAARSGLREGAAFKLQDLLQPHHQPLCRGSASLCRRAHCGARAAPDGAAARLGGRAQPSVSGLAGRRSSRRQLGALARTTASRTRRPHGCCRGLAPRRREFSTASTVPSGQRADGVRPRHLGRPGFRANREFLGSRAASPVFGLAHAFGGHGMRLAPCWTARPRSCSLRSDRPTARSCGDSLHAKGRRAGWWPSAEPEAPSGSGLTRWRGRADHQVGRCRVEVA